MNVQILAITLHFFRRGFHTNRSGKPFHIARLCTNVYVAIDRICCGVRHFKASYKKYQIIRKKFVLDDPYEKNGFRLK